MGVSWQGFLPLPVPARIPKPKRKGTAQRSPCWAQATIRTSRHFVLRASTDVRLVVPTAPTLCHYFRPTLFYS